MYFEGKKTILKSQSLSTVLVINRVCNYRKKDYYIYNLFNYLNIIVNKDCAINITNTNNRIQKDYQTKVKLYSNSNA